MKTILLTLAMAASALVSMAQKGSWYIGGTVGYSTLSSENASGFKTTYTSWSLAPEAGTFLKDNIQLGLALGLSGTSSENDNTKIQTTTTISPTAYVRKFYKITDDFSAFAGFYLNFINGTSTNYLSTPSVESTQSGIAARVGVGVAYSLSPRFTAVGQYGVLGYQSITSKTAGTKTGSDSSFSFNVNTVGTGSVFNVGLYYTFKQAQ